MHLRWLFQFRLRTLLVALTALSVWLGLHVRSVRMQKDAVQAIHDYGGWIRYDFQFPSGEFSYKEFDPNAESTVPKWLLGRLGVDFFHSVVQVNLNYSNDSGTRLENYNPTDAALQHLPNLPNLKVLLLSDLQASDDSMVHLAKLKRLERLLMWDVSQVSDAGVEHLRNLTALKQIHINDSGITDESLQVFGRLKNLEELALQGNRFTDEGLSYLTGLTNLTTLYVGRGDNHITDNGVLHLCQIENLEAIGLQGTQVTSQGLEQLATLQKLKSLVVSKGRLGDTTKLAETLEGCRLHP